MSSRDVLMGNRRGNTEVILDLGVEIGPRSTRLLRRSGSWTLFWSALRVTVVTTRVLYMGYGVSGVRSSLDAFGPARMAELSALGVGTRFRHVDLHVWCGCYGRKDFIPFFFDRSYK
jgi:hypothetical protein